MSFHHPRNLAGTVHTTSRTFAGGAAISIWLSIIVQGSAVVNRPENREQGIEGKKDKGRER